MEQERNTIKEEYLAFINRDTTQRQYGIKYLTEKEVLCYLNYRINQDLEEIQSFIDKAGTKEEKFAAFLQYAVESGVTVFCECEEYFGNHIYCLSDKMNEKTHYYDYGCYYFDFNEEKVVCPYINPLAMYDYIFEDFDNRAFGMETVERNLEMLRKSKDIEISFLPDECDMQAYLKNYGREPADSLEEELEER